MNHSKLQRGALALDVPNVGAIVKFEGHVRVLLTIKDNKESSQGFFFKDNKESAQALDASNVGNSR